MSRDALDGRGALAAMAVGAALISTSAVFVRWVAVPPTVSAFWRMALGALLLLAWVARPRARLRLSTPVLALVALASGCFALDLWLWHRSIRAVGVGLATLLGNFQVFALAGFGALLLGERGGWRLWTGLVLALAGLALLLAPDWNRVDARFHAGVGFGLGTAVAYAAFLLCFRAAQARRGAADSEGLLWWLCLFTAGLLGLVALLAGEALQPPAGRDWAALLAYALVAQVFGWVVIGRVMPRLSAGVLGLCLLLQPLLAYGWDALLFGARLGPVGLVGLALSLSGIFLGLTRRAAVRPDVVAGDGRAGA